MNSQSDLHIYSREFCLLTDLVAVVGLKEASDSSGDSKKHRCGAHKHCWVLSFSPFPRAIDKFLSVLSNPLLESSSWSNWLASLQLSFLLTQSSPQSSFLGFAGSVFSPTCPSSRLGIASGACRAFSGRGHSNISWSLLGVLRCTCVFVLFCADKGYCEWGSWKGKKMVGMSLALKSC